MTTTTATDPKRTARQLAAAARAEDQSPVDVDPTRCTAYGCPLRGSVDVGNTGRFQCHCHAHAGLERWPAITQAIRQHEWMLRIIRDVKAAGSQHTQWRKVAMLAWAVEPEMVPDADETQALYVARLLQDFEHRVGAREHKPGPQVRQRTMPEWAPKHAPASSIDGATAIGSVL